MALLEFNQVFKNFDSKQVLSNIDLKVEPGMVLGLLGRNGAGKTTLLRIALGLVEQDYGTVTCLDSNNSSLSPQCKSQIGYVPQQPSGYQGFKVADALALHRSFYPKWDMDLENDWLERFQLDRKATVSNLSIGQQQSLSLIFAMAYRPKLLVLDEPVSSLDPIARREFMSDLFELALESESGVIFSSHITSDVERVASHIALIKEGKVVVSGELDLLKEQIRLLPCNHDIDLPDGQILHQSENYLVYQALNGTTWPNNPAINSLNLERLFVELHG